jgi:hypothetical protein
MVFELRRDVVRRPAESERPAVDVRRHRSVARLVDAGRHARGVGVEEPGGKRDVSEPRGHVDEDKNQARYVAVGKLEGETTLSIR